MPDFKYRAVLRDGKVIRGKLLAPSKHQAILRLKDAKIQPIVVKRLKPSKNESNKLIKKPKKIKYTPKIAAKPKINLRRLTFEDLKTIEIHPFSRIKTKDIITFVNNFYILKKANFNNIQALKSLFEGTENPRFKDIIEDILVGVEAGQRINSVMENYPKVFPPMFINFVKVGEESGTLDTALLHARDYLESSTKLSKQIKAAVIPRVAQFVGIIVAIFAAVIIGVPMLTSIYETFGSNAEVPAATLAALDAAEWLIKNWYLITIVIIAIAVVFFTYINTSRGRYNWDKLLMKFPVAGRVNTNITISKFFQAMLLNLKNGMRIQESLDVSKSVSNNYYFLSLVEVARSNSIIGESWITPFHENEVFKPMVASMLTTGMKTNLAEMMEKVNEYIEMEIEDSVSKFVKWLPDITYVFVGIALIAFVIIVMIPIINVYMGSFITF